MKICNAKGGKEAHYEKEKHDVAEPDLQQNGRLCEWLVNFLGSQTLFPAFCILVSVSVCFIDLDQAVRRQLT